MKNNIIQYVLTLCSLVNSGICFAQTSVDPKKVDVRFSLNFGAGKGYPESQNQIGISGAINAGVEYKKSIYEIGIRGLSEINLIGINNVTNSASSVDLTFGKYIQVKRFLFSLHSGIGFVKLTQRGLLNSSEGGLFSSVQGGFFGYYNYEKLKTNVIGVPISTKILWKPINHFAIGIECYANFNKGNSFFTVNICNQFFNLKKHKKK